MDSFIIITLVKSIVFIMLFLLGAYFSGYAVRRFFIKDCLRLTIKNAFLNSLFGLVVIIFLYSLSKTHGNTVNIFYLCPAILFLCYHTICRKPNKNIRLNVDSEILPTLNRWQIVIILGFIVLIFAIHVANCISWKHQIFISTAGDAQDWASYIKSLISGSENRDPFVNIIFSHSTTIMYHWAELWLAALATDFAGIPPKVANDIFTSTVLFSILFLAFLSIVPKKQLCLKTISFVSLVPHFSLVTIYLLVIGKILNISTITSTSHFWGRWILPKDILPLCFTILAIALLTSNKRFYAICSLLCIIPTDCSWWPTVFSACAGVLVLEVFSTSTTWPAKITLVGIESIGCLTSGLGLIAFYWNNLRALDSLQSDWISNYSLIEQIVMPLTEAFIYSFPFFITIWLLRKYLHKPLNEKAIYILFGWAILGGYLAYLLNIKIWDAPQLFKGYILINLAAWMSILHLSFPPKTMQYFLVNLVICLISLTLACRTVLRQNHGARHWNYNECSKEYREQGLTYAKATYMAKGSVVFGQTVADDFFHKFSFLYPDRGFSLPLDSYFCSAYVVSLDTFTFKNKGLVGSKLAYINNPLYRFATNCNYPDPTSVIENFTLKYLDYLQTIGEVKLPRGVQKQLQLLSTDDTNQLKLYKIISTQ